MIKKTIKEEVISSKVKLQSSFKSGQKIYAAYIANIHHQYVVTSSIQRKLAEDEAFIHMDFSENYQCKYSEEVQSVHFGGSRNQVSLHTVVAYYRKNNKTLSRSICTFSVSLRHNAVAACAHLEPVVAQVKLNVPNIRKIHFMSDGPSTQYATEIKTFFILLLLF